MDSIKKVIDKLKTSGQSIEVSLIEYNLQKETNQYEEAIYNINDQQEEINQQCINQLMEIEKLYQSQGVIA